MARVGTGVLVSVKTRDVTTVTVKTLEISVCRGAVAHWTPEDIKLMTGHGRGSLETPTQMCVQLTCNSKTISNQLSAVIKFGSEDIAPILTI